MLSRILNKPVLDKLVFWGTAAPPHVVSQNDWAADFRSVNIIYPDTTTTAFFGDTDFTVATWVKPTNVSAFDQQVPYSQWNGNGGERKFYFVNDNAADYVGFFVFKQGFGDAGVTTLGGHGKMVNGNWYRLVGIHRKDHNVSLYRNGQFVDLTAWTHGVESADEPTRQQPWVGGLSRGGINYDPDRFWRGAIGPTCYYTRPWTSQEVVWDYNDGKGRRYSELGRAGTDGELLLNNLIAFWQLTEQDTGLGPYIVRRDSHTGHHDLTQRIGGSPVSVEGILPKKSIADDERVYQLTDRSPEGNSLTQSDNDRRPYWDAQSHVVSIEPGNLLKNTAFTGLHGAQLSLYLVSILKRSTELRPWLFLSHGGIANPGLKIYREDDMLKVKAWIGGGTKELSYRLSYPAERLIEIHYNGHRLSLWENGRQRAAVHATGGFTHPLDTLDLGPDHGFSELMIYDEAHR